MDRMILMERHLVYHMHARMIAVLVHIVLNRQRIQTSTMKSQYPLVYDQSIHTGCQYGDIWYTQIHFFLDDIVHHKMGILMDELVQSLIQRVSR